MAEANEPEPSEDGEQTFDAAAVATAAALDEARDDPALRPDLAAFFAAQRELIEAQKHHLHVQLNQLRLKIAGDWMRLALQGLTLIAILIVVVVIGSIVRDAMEDHGLVIESFSAPPDMVARGLTGEALAEQLEGHLAAIRSIANAGSITVSDDVRSGGEDTLKVDIPETGLSLDQIERFLRQKLGHASRLDGAVSDEGDGKVRLDLHLSGSDPISVEGPGGDIDALMQQAAEKAFASFDPINYVLYLFREDRAADGLAAAQHNFDRSRTPIEVYNALSLWANVDGDRPMALRRAILATQVYPKGWAGWSEASKASGELGHDEDSLRFSRRMIATRIEDQWRNHRAMFPYLQRQHRMRVDSLLGDYRQLAVDTLQPLVHDRRTLALRYVDMAAADAGLHDCAALQRDLAAAELADLSRGRSQLTAEWNRAVCENDWPAAVTVARAMADATSRDLTSAVANDVIELPLWRTTVDTPRLALALSKTGQVAAAQALIAGTPLDCYLCLRTRGQVAEAAGDHAAADRWFAEAVRQAPSLPFAYLEWGQARLARGDVAGAITEFQLGQSKGPRFADMPEAWGEALARRGDYAGAVAQYASANALAPHWRRLHQAWSQALQKLGRTREAQAQLALAGG
jgi:tetratricopeptide (TPR) repeat protein